MIKNIFAKAQFGDKFVTRAGKMALYCFAPKLGNACLIEGSDKILTYRYDGLLFDNRETEYDIVSKYKKPITLDEYYTFDDDESFSV